MENTDINKETLVSFVLEEYEQKRKIEENKKAARKEFLQSELKELEKLSRIIFYTLASIIITTGIFICMTYTIDYFGIHLLWTSVLAGILGSTCSAFLSALDRKAHGWEDESGNKYPKDEPKDKFSRRMATFFLCRPLFGILAGLLAFFGMQAKYFGNTGIEDQSKVIFWSLLSGLFVKSLIEKLKDIFDSFVFGKKQ